MYYSLENFIDYCDEYQIANESKFSEGLAGVVDRVVAAFTKIYEQFHRAILSLKQKMSNSKFISVPKTRHDKLQAMLGEISVAYKGKASNLSNDVIEKLTSKWEAVRKQIKEEKSSSKSQDSNIQLPANKVYANMIASSKLITASINDARKLQKDLKNIKEEDMAVYKEAIQRFQNQRVLASMYMQIYSAYLSCKFVSSKKVTDERDVISTMN